MNDIVLQLCVLSIVCGFMMYLLPEGGCKTIGRVLCTSVLIICILEPVIEFDFESYALQSALLHETEAAFSANAKERRDNLNKTVIEQEYREYILDKANESGISEFDVKICSRWDEHEIWVPYSAEIGGSFSIEQKKELEAIIRDELGIPEERQIWKLG